MKILLCGRLRRSDKTILLVTYRAACYECVLSHRRQSGAFVLMGKVAVRWTRLVHGWVTIVVQVVAFVHSRYKVRWKVCDVIAWTRPYTSIEGEPTLSVGLYTTLLCLGYSCRMHETLIMQLLLTVSWLFYTLWILNKRNLSSDSFIISFA